MRICSVLGTAKFSYYKRRCQQYTAQAPADSRPRSLWMAGPFGFQQEFIRLPGGTQSGFHPTGFHQVGGISIKTSRRLWWHKTCCKTSRRLPWCPKKGLRTVLTALSPLCLLEMRTWKAETRKYHAVVSSPRTWYPECSVTNALDERDERLGVDSLMQLAERVHDIPTASVEHDGVVFWFKRESYNEANLMAQVRRVSQGLAFAVKALRIPVELARELYPTRGFKRVSGLDSIAFLDNWRPSRQSGRTHSGRPATPSHSFFGIFTATSSSRTPTT